MMVAPAASSNAWKLRGYSRVTDYDPALRSTYKVWRAIKDQCRHGSGAICGDWRRSFDEFVKSVGIRPERGFLVRLDRQKAWQPGNVRWEIREREPKP